LALTPSPEHPFLPLSSFLALTGYVCQMVFLYIVREKMNHQNLACDKHEERKTTAEL